MLCCTLVIVCTLFPGATQTSTGLVGGLGTGLGTGLGLQQQVGHI